MRDMKIRKMVLAALMAALTYVATMVVDDNGIPEQFTYTYEDLGITMIRTVSQIREEQ